jgi:hypothetical protein
MSRHTDSTTHCRRQAAECGKRASEATLAEIREAYVNLKQGWLHLAPDTGDDRNSMAEGGRARRIASTKGRPGTH